MRRRRPGRRRRRRGVRSRGGGEGGASTGGGGGGGGGGRGVLGGVAGGGGVGRGVDGGGGMKYYWCQHVEDRGMKKCMRATFGGARFCARHTPIFAAENTVPIWPQNTV